MIEKQMADDHDLEEIKNKERRKKKTSYISLET